MRCEEVRPLISAGLDGELEASRAAQVRAHLTECVLCSAEREVLAETVRLLRALPESEPPAELRRRIGAALLDVERASERRWLGLSLLGRPHTSGWAWGAALGMVAATMALVATRGREHHSYVRPARMAAVPSAPPAPVSSPAETTAPVPGTAPSPKALAAVPVKPGETTALTAAAAVQPPLRTTPVPPAAASPALSAAAPVPRRAHPAVVKAHSAPRRWQIAPRVGPRIAAAAHGAARLVPRAGAASKNAEPPVDRSPLLAHSEPAPSPGATTLPPPDTDDLTSTAGMTQMASGNSTADPPAADSDDLSDLRRRLTDRPLQVPELGELKPSAAPRPARDGWIRF